MSDLTWIDRCERARFREFEFLTDSHEARGGRRLVVHEYPGADEPLVEDMGGKAWDYRLSAYFIGPNYDLERNGFLALLAEPGADWLIHPWFGLVWVRAASWSVSESNEAGGYCKIDLDFVPGGEAPFEVETDRVDVAYERTRVFAEAAVADYVPEALSADGLSSFIAAIQGRLDVLRSVLSLATVPLTWAARVMGLVQSVKTDIAALMAIPGAYANALLGLSNMLGFGPDDNNVDLADTARPRVVRRLVSLAAAGPAVLSGIGATDPAVRRMVVAEEALRSRLVLAAAARIALADYRVAEDRDAVLLSVLNAIDEALPSMSDPVFQAAVNLRVALIDALMAQDLAPAQAKDIVQALPSVLLAHRMSIDEDVLIARNRVRHPLFVQGRVYG